MNNNKPIDISLESVVKITAFFLLLYFCYVIKNVLFILFISVIVVLIMKPAVDWFEKKKISRVLGALIIYLALIAFFVLVALIVVPPLARESTQLTVSLPRYFDMMSDKVISFRQVFESNNLTGSLENFINRMNVYLEESSVNIFSSIVSLLGGVVYLIVILVISFYLVVEKRGVERLIKQIVPPNLQNKSLKIIGKIEIKLSRWFVGQLALGFIIGLMSYIGLSILGVPYALVLAIIAGLFELVPYIGPWLSAVPAILIALTISPALAGAVLVLYFVIQELENYFIVPKVMEKSVDIHPVITIMAMMIGGQLAGLAGVILAVPVAAMVLVAVEEVYKK